MPLLSLGPSPVYVPTYMIVDEAFEDVNECRAFNGSIRTMIEMRC
jgi:hypothetical protein